MTINLENVKRIYHWPGEQSYVEMQDGDRVDLNGRDDVENLLIQAKGEGFHIVRGRGPGDFRLRAIPQPEPVDAETAVVSTEPPAEANPKEKAQLQVEQSDWYTQYMINRIYTKWGLRNPATGRFMRSSYRERNVNY